MNTRTGECIATVAPTAEPGAVNDGCVSPDSRWVATADDQGVLRVFNLDTCNLVASTRIDGALFD